MPQNITDVDEFTDPIVMPADADPANLTYITTLTQGLANRTRNLRNVYGAYGGLCIADGVGGSTFVAPPQYPTFTNATWWNAALPSDAAGIIVPNLGADGLFVTEAGLYEVHAHFTVLSPTFDSDTVVDTYRAAIGVDGVPSTEITDFIEVADANTVAKAVLSGIITVGEDELVTVRVSATGSSGGIKVGAGSFRMRRLA